VRRHRHDLVCLQGRTVFEPLPAAGPPAARSVQISRGQSREPANPDISQSSVPGRSGISRNGIPGNILEQLSRPVAVAVLFTRYQIDRYSALSAHASPNARKPSQAILAPGNRDAPVSSCSQNRHPAGKTILASAPPASASQAGARPRPEAKAAARDFPMARAYVSVINNQY
jgi:hypothetical protein